MLWKSTKYFLQDRDLRHKRVKSNINNFLDIDCGYLYCYDV